MVLEKKKFFLEKLHSSDILSLVFKWSNSQMKIDEIFLFINMGKDRNVSISFSKKEELVMIITLWMLFNAMLSETI